VFIRPSISIDISIENKNPSPQFIRPRCKGICISSLREEMNNAMAPLKIKMDEGSVCAVSLARSGKPSAK